MATSDGTLGSGVKIFIAIGSPHSWIQVPGVREITQLPNRERDQVESTVHGVTSERTYIGGLATVNPLEFTLRADLSSGSVHRSLQDYERQQTDLWWRVEVPIDADLAATQYFIYMQLGRVTTWNPLAPIDDLKEIEVSVQYSGSQFYLQGASAA